MQSFNGEGDALCEGTTRSVIFGKLCVYDIFHFSVMKNCV